VDSGFGPLFFMVFMHVDVKVITKGVGIMEWSEIER